MGLFQWGRTRLASGRESAFKIECEALTMEDWLTLGNMAALILPPFQRVEGVPEGGIKFQMGLIMYQTMMPDDPLLIVDDVFTTGGSMEKFRNGRPAIGCVAFARGPVPDWVTVISTLHPKLWGV